MVKPQPRIHTLVMRGVNEQHGWMLSAPWEPEVGTAFAKARFSTAMPSALPDVVEIRTAEDLQPSEALGAMVPVMTLEAELLFGTARPTRAMIEAAAQDLMQLRPFDTGVYVTAYDQSGRPREWIFCGSNVQAQTTASVAV